MCSAESAAWIDGPGGYAAVVGKVPGHEHVAIHTPHGAPAERGRVVGGW